MGKLFPHFINLGLPTVYENNPEDFVFYNKFVWHTCMHIKAYMCA